MPTSSSNIVPALWFSESIVDHLRYTHTTTVYDQRRHKHQSVSTLATTKTKTCYAGIPEHINETFLEDHLSFLFALDKKHPGETE